MKNIAQFINERDLAPIKKINNKDIHYIKPHVEMVSIIINQLSEKPDYKGKDKELWDSAGQFLYDYLKELNSKQYEEIVKELDLQDIRSQKELTAPDVQMAVSLKLGQ